MRRTGLIGLLVAVSLVSAPARAGHQVNHEEPFTLQALPPCAVACAYWLDYFGFGACDAPFPPSSYADLTVSAPRGTDYLRVDIFPEMDWDLFLCSLSGRLLAAGAHSLDEPCKMEEPVPLGCHERALIPLRAGDQVVIRAYNWSDVFPLQGKYTFVNVD